MPAFVPPALATLSRFAGAPYPSAVRDAVRRTVAEFRRTHQDEWDACHRDKFSSEQLACLTDVRSEADYFC